MSENTATPVYISYLLRLRRLSGPGSDTYQVMVQQVGSNEQHFFPNLEALLRFLSTDPAGEEVAGPD